jgi:hypothetical protein
MIEELFNFMPSSCQRQTKQGVYGEDESLNEPTTIIIIIIIG